MTTATEAFTGTGALSGSWTAYVGSGGTRVSDQLEPNSPGASHGSYWNADSFGVNQRSKVTCVNGLFHSGAATYITVSARISGSGATRRCYQFSASYNVWYITKVVDGSGVDYNSGGTSRTFAAGDTIELRVTGTNPTTIAGYHNGEKVGEYTDTDSPFQDGAPGFEIYGGTGPPLPTFDDWEGGDVSSAPPAWDYRPDVQQIFHNPR